MIMKYVKEGAINHVLINGESILVVSLDIGLSHDSLLHLRIKKYKESVYNIVERKRECLTIPKISKKKRK